MLNVAESAMKHNQELCIGLAAQLAAPVGDSTDLIATSFTNVPNEVIRQFLADFRYHELDVRIDQAAILRYIDEVYGGGEDGKAQSWNVMLFKSNSQRETDTFDFGGAVGVPVQTVRRAK